MEKTQMLSEGVLSHSVDVKKNNSEANPCKEFKSTCVAISSPVMG